MLRVAVERFGADADVVKDMVCTNKVGEKKRGGKKLERPETGQDIPQETVEGAKYGECFTQMARASFRNRGAVLQRLSQLSLQCAPRSD